MMTEEEFVRVHLTMDKKLKEDGKRLARERGLSLSAYIRTLVIEDLKKDKKK